MHRCKGPARAGILGGLVASLALAAPALAQDEVNTKRLRDAVTVNGILQHERALQSIANANGGTRASGTPGYAASAAYVRGRLQRAGYRVREQELRFPFFRNLAPAQLQQLSPTPKAYGTDTLDYSPSGDVTGRVQEVADNLFPPPAQPGSTAGCEASDFAGFQPGNVALIQRGTCTFAIKATNAQQAGASAVIIFNEGQEGRQELLAGTLGETEVSIPVVALSFPDAQELHAQLGQGDLTVRVVTSTEINREARTTNVLADTAGGNADQKVVVGAHLDSVVEGPGINDNGSGTSTILEIAEEMSELGIKPRRQVRFAFWGAEEAGLLGSQHYVSQLSPDEVSEHYANLNFDMVGSPNYVRFVYDGDGSATGISGPPGSAQIEGIFARYFGGQGLATDPTPFNGRSDYGPFIAVGIPAGGLFSGAEGIKTPEQAAVYGGTPGVAYDPCYHQACDTVSNLNTRSLNELSDGAAHATLTLARSRSGLFEDGSRRARGAKKVRAAQRGPQARRAAQRGPQARR